MLVEVYYPRIQRNGRTNYLCTKFGAFGADLSALAHFFKHGDSEPWQTPVAGLENNDKARVLSVAAFDLRALGRPQESIQPLQASLARSIELKNWIDAAIDISNLSELQLTLGDLGSALKAAQQTVDFAGQGGNVFWQVLARATLADNQIYIITVIHGSRDLAFSNMK